MGSGLPPDSDGENLRGGRQPTLGGMGGGSWVKLAPCSGSSRGVPAGTGGHRGSCCSGPVAVPRRKMWRFIGTGLLAEGG